jgi:hypothetical protein
VKHPFAAPLSLVVLALISCTSSTATVSEESQAPSNATAPAEKSTAGTAAVVDEPQGTAPQGGTASATPLKDFKDRLDKYTSIRKSADDHTPPLKRTEDPGKIEVAQDALAKRIHDLRASAKHGDIFSPEISAYFRRLLRPELKDKGTKDSIADDNPGNIPYLKVNAVYPENEPLSTVPPNVLITLPPLPEDIEFRFVGRHLILRDSRANLIIDYIPNALP